MRDPAGLCVLSRLRQRVAVGTLGHRGRRALAARIHASRGVLGKPVGACGLFGQLQGARIYLGEAGTARGWGRRHGRGRHAPHRGMVIVRVGCLDTTWGGSGGLTVLDSRGIIITLEYRYCSINIE